MKKALWFRLLQPNPAQALDRPGDELVRYRRARLLRRLTPERAKAQRLYHARAREWLRQPENRWCKVHLLLSGQRVAATQCHHYQGRRGSLLLYEPLWIPVSWEGHRWINENRERARALGLLCPMGRYNSPVDTTWRE